MGLTEVIGEVRRQGDERSEAILAAARKEAESILAAAREQARSYESARLEAARRESATLAAAVASRAESDARKAVLSGEAQLRAEFRARVLAALDKLPAKSREAHLRTLLGRAAEVIPKGSIWGAAQDTTLLSAQKTYKHMGSEAMAGGIIVESADGQTRLDLSYETLLDEAWRDIVKAEAGLFA